MSTFDIYLRLGFQHILDPGGLDHVLFIIALVASYANGSIKSLLALVTAFTLGHSLTLALAVLDLVHISQPLIETLIPITILITAVYHLVRKSEKGNNLLVSYAMALGFGLIHGLGFSGYLRSLLTESSELVFALLSFNIGLELGQLIVVTVVIGLGTLLIRFWGLSARIWNYCLSGSAALFSVFLIFSILTD